MSFFTFLIVLPFLLLATSKAGNRFLGDLSLGVLQRSHKKKYPLVLLKLMMRYGEDLVWANKIKEGEEVLKFLVDLTEQRNDASVLRKGQFVYLIQKYRIKYVYILSALRHRLTIERSESSLDQGNGLCSLNSLLDLVVHL